jgi:hypothetical protein
VIVCVCSIFHMFMYLIFVCTHMVVLFVMSLRPRFTHLLSFSVLTILLNPPIVNLNSECVCFLRSYQRTMCEMSCPVGLGLGVAPRLARATPLFEGRERSPVVLDRDVHVIMSTLCQPHEGWVVIAPSWFRASRGVIVSP